MVRGTKKRVRRGRVRETRESKALLGGQGEKKGDSNQYVRSVGGRSENNSKWKLCHIVVAEQRNEPTKPNDNGHKRVICYHFLVREVSQQDCPSVVKR